MRAHAQGPRYDRHKAAVAARQRFKAWMRSRGLARCEVCKWAPPPLRPESWSVLQAAHVVPVCCGGSDEFSNLALLCPNHHAIMNYFMKHRPWRNPGGPREYHGPRSREALIEWLRRVDKDPEGFLRDEGTAVAVLLDREMP